MATPLNVDRFVTPEQTFEGLDRVSSTLERKGYRDEQMRLRQEERDQNAEAKRAASSRFFANYLDPKDRFTGTKFDPKVYSLLNEAKNQAYELAKKGANDTDILAAINPMVAKTDEYVQKAKQINEQKKAALTILKEQKGIDPIKFADEFDDEVFFETDPTTGQKKERDLNTIDPSSNYADVVLKNRPVYTNQGFDEFVGKSGKDTVVEDVSVYDRNRAMRRTKAEITKPSFMISEKDSRGAHIGFVPEYDIASDGDQPLMHDFMTSEGIKETAPVRMVTDEVFRSISPASKAYLRQEAIKYAKENNIDPSDARVENFAKALAYDELKRSAKQYSTLKEVSVQKAPPIIINNRGGSGSGESNINNVYKGIDDKINSNFSKGFTATRFNSLSNDQQEVVKKAANNAGYDVDEGGRNLFLSKDKDGNIKIYKTGDDGKPYITPEAEIAVLSFPGTNLSRQPGVPEKREVVEMGAQKTPPPAQKLKAEDLRKKYNY